MNELRNRVRKLEEIAKEKKGGKRIILWKGPGDTEQSLLKGYSEEERSRAIIFQWTVEGVDVPMPEEVDEDFLNRPMSPELKEKVQEVINDGQINSPQRPRKR